MKKFLLILSLLFSIGCISPTVTIKAQPIKAIVTMKHSSGAITDTIWNLSSVTADGISFDASAQVTEYIITIALKPDGTKLYVVDNGAGTTMIYQYTLSTPYNVSTASYDSKSLNAGGSISQIWFSNDGLNLYYARESAFIGRRPLSTAWDISTAGASTSFNDGTQITSTQSAGHSISNLTKYYAALNTTSTIYQYNASTAGDVTTLSYASKSASLTSQIAANNLWGIFLNSSGSALYANDQTNSVIYQYSLSTPGDLSTISYASKSYNYLSALGGFVSTGIYIIGNKLYIAQRDNVNKKIFQFSIPYQ